MTDWIGIQPAPTAANAAIQLHPSDNVAIARVPLDPGAEVLAGESRITVGAFIPAGHKLALRHIPACANVIRYGCSIGIASGPIQPGEHVHR